MRKSGLTGDEAYALSKRRRTSGDLGPLKKELSLLKEDLSNKITKFYASNQGETHITDSDNGKIMDIMLYGKSEQFTTTGKNLLKIKDRTQTTRGITITAKDGVVALKGTATETGWAMLDVDSFVLDGMYILSSNTNARIVVASKTFKSILEQNKSATLENAEVSKVCFTVIEGKTYDISNILIQIEKGSVATSYEPYTGGNPSPNPPYPQEIKSVVNPTVNFLGANILNIKNTEETVSDKNGLTYSVKNGVIKIKGTATSNISIGVMQQTANTRLKLKKNNTYIFNPNPVKTKESDNVYLDFTNSYSIGFSFKSNNVNKPIKITENDIKREFDLVVRVKQGEVIDMEWKPQLLLNESLLPYKPYTEQSVTLPITLNAVPVNSGGNVTINGQQYVADYVDVERGKVVKYLYAGKLGDLRYGVKPAADTNWYDASISNSFELTDLTYKGVEFKGRSPIVGFCNKAKTYTFSNFYKKGIECGVMNTESYIVINLPISLGISTPDLFREWSNECYIIKMLTAPIESNLTVEEIEAFKKLSAYYPTTNISVASDQLDGYAVFNYPISMANGWNYVKQQLNDNRDYIYDMDTKTQDIDTQAAEAYVNSEYAVALTELEV